jgi:hypothetical protein
MPQTSQVTVTTTATLLVTANRADQMVYLHSKHAVYVGGPGVTSSTGYLIDNGDKLSMMLSDNESLYAITGAGSGIMQVMVTIN